MKCQSKFFNYFMVCIATLSLATFAACGSDDDPEPPAGELVLEPSANSFAAGDGNVTFKVKFNGEDVTSKAVIKNTTSNTTVENATWTTATPGDYSFQATYENMTSNIVSVKAERALVLKASADSFLAGEGNVTFTVTFKGEDVTSKAVINNTTSGTPTAIEGTTWTTDTPGSYKFQATYNEQTSDVITVTAKDKQLYRSVLLLKFTATWCQPCAQAENWLHELDQADQDRFVVVAAHQSMEDILRCDEGVALARKMGATVWPTWSYNFGPTVTGIYDGNITKATIRSQISYAKRTYPAVTGVKATSKLEGTTAKIEATVMFQEAGNYKIACVLTEDNIPRTNSGDAQDSFSQVLRTAQTDMEGDAITPAVTEASERTFNFEATIKDGWKAENCHFVVYVFKEEADGKYIVNSGAQCALNGTVNYKYE